MNSNDADNGSLGTIGTPSATTPENSASNDNVGSPSPNLNASGPHSSTAATAQSAISATSVRTHQIINELLIQNPGSTVTCSRSADNTNANNENGKKTSKHKTSGNLTAAPSRKVSILQNLAKIHPFSPSRTSASQPQPGNNNTNADGNVNGMDEEQRAECSCPDELCVLKVVAPLPLSEELVTSWNSGGKIASRNESIANMIVDINRKESQMTQETSATGTDADGAATTMPAVTTTAENGTPTATATAPSTTVVRCTESDSMEGFCRICHDNPSKMTLIAPCSCKGSMGLVHRTCLERWLGESGKQNCEICNTEFITERRPRYTGFRSFYQWLKNPLSPTDTRNLFFDLACFLVLTPLAAMSAWLCIVVITQDANDGRNGNLLDLSGTGAANGRRRNRGFWRNEYNNDPDNTTWTSIGLLTLTGTLLAAYYVWIYVAIRYHVQIWHEWQRHNYVVTIVPVTPGRERPAAGGAASSSSGSGQSSARDPHEGHHSDPGAPGNTHAHAGAGNRDHGRSGHNHGARERSRSHSVGNRKQSKHKPGGSSARSKARPAAVAQMDQIYNLSGLTEYHALLMASANFEDFSSSNSSSSVPSIPSESSGYNVVATHNARSGPGAGASSRPHAQVMKTTILDTPDREVIIIEPASLPSSLSNFSVNAELELEPEFVTPPEAKLSDPCIMVEDTGTASAAASNIPEVVCITGANNNEASSSSPDGPSSSTQSVQEKLSSEVLT